MATVADQENEHRGIKAQAGGPAEPYLGRKVSDVVVMVPAYSLLPAAGHQVRGNHCRAQHDDIINELTTEPMH